MDDQTHEPLSELRGMQFVARWKTLQPIDQGRPWRWGKPDFDALRESLWGAVRALSAELAPAGTLAVRDAYEKLSSVYQSKGAEKPEARVAMWLDAFQDWPRCALAEAVRAWSVKDTSFMPTPGQFHACGAHAIERRRADLADVRQVLKIMDKPSDGDVHEYAADPAIVAKLQRLSLAMRNGENLARLRARGEI